MKTRLRITEIIALAVPNILLIAVGIAINIMEVSQTSPGAGGITWASDIIIPLFIFAILTVAQILVFCLNGKFNEAHLTTIIILSLAKGIFTFVFEFFLDILNIYFVGAYKIATSVLMLSFMVLALAATDRKSVV